MGNCHFVVSGFSGAGKSVLLSELQSRGHAVVFETGKRTISTELRTCGYAIPLIDNAAYARKVVEMSIQDITLAEAQEGRLFFDGGLVDTTLMLERVTGEAAVQRLCWKYRYNIAVFIAPPSPPWAPIDLGDREQRAALARYDQLTSAYLNLGYRLVHLPPVSVAARADFVLKTLQDCA